MYGDDNKLNIHALHNTFLCENYNEVFTVLIVFRESRLESAQYANNTKYNSV